MRIIFTTLALSALVACGGSEPAKPAPAPAPAAEKKAEPAPEKKAEPVAEKKADDPAAAFAAMDEAGKQAMLMELGKTVYETGGSGGLACQTCHQANGEGLPPTYPPLKGATEFMGSCEQHAGWVINGLNGEIEVLGQKYNGAMPAQANLSDLEIAAAITYERRSWGNEGTYCMPEQVASAR